MSWFKGQTIHNKMTWHSLFTLLKCNYCNGKMFSVGVTWLDVFVMIPTLQYVTSSSACFEEGNVFQNLYSQKLYSSGNVLHCVRCYLAWRLSLGPNIAVDDFLLSLYWRSRANVRGRSQILLYTVSKSINPNISTVY